MKKRQSPLVNEDTPSQSDQDKRTVNAVFERMMESRHPASPMPFRTLVRNASDLSSWQRAVRQHTKTRADARGAPDELMVLEKLVRNALEKARQTSRESLEKA